ncbi:MAG: hypothetical protein K8R13_00385 [Methanococcoides sp.]|nr:hypothetical protein [Methanococcoides sp.]
MSQIIEQTNKPGNNGKRSIGITIKPCKTYSRTNLSRNPKAELEAS